MKRKIINIIILIVSITALWDCESWVPREEIKVGDVYTPTGTIFIQGKYTSDVEYQIVIIDSCEYIIGNDRGTQNGGFFMTHKGNCKNPIHKFQQQIVSADASIMNKKREDMIFAFKVLLTQKEVGANAYIPFKNNL